MDRAAQALADLFYADRSTNSYAEQAQGPGPIRRARGASTLSPIKTAAATPYGLPVCCAHA